MFGNISPRPDPLKTALRDLERHVPKVTPGTEDRNMGYSPAASIIGDAVRREPNYLPNLVEILKGRAPLEVFHGQHPEPIAIYVSDRYHLRDGELVNQPFLGVSLSNGKRIDVRFSEMFHQFILSSPQLFPLDPSKYIGRIVNLATAGRVFSLMPYESKSGDLYVPTVATETGRVVDKKNIKLPVIE